MAFVKRNLKLKKIELGDLDVIRKFTFKFEPYSDFNAISIWTYNTKDLAEYGFYNNNLVMKYTDYLTNAIFLTLLGTEEIPETIERILVYASENGIDLALKLVPEITAEIARQTTSHLAIEEDEDNFDYIYSLESLTELEGGNHKDERNLCNTFLNTYPNSSVEVLNINSYEVKNALKDVYNKWIENKTTSDKYGKDGNIELTAFNKLLRDSEYFKVVCLGLKVEDKCVAFTISEALEDGGIMSIFTKADINYKGSFQFVDQKRAEFFHNLGYKFLNLEQDLGKQGLRQAKRSWRPIRYLKKYTIASKQL